MDRTLLTAAAIVCAAIAPALAYSAPEDAKITARDPYAFAPTTVTIAPGEKVTFEYPSGPNGHNVAFPDGRPDCDASVPDGSVYGTAPWKGDCRFPRAGRYAFVCRVHEDQDMRGVVVVEAPAPSPTATATPAGSASPAPSASPQPGASPSPTPTASPKPATVKATVARTQRGSRVRGTIATTKGARVEVRVSRKGRRVARWMKTATGTTTRFSVRSRPGRLTVAITVDRAKRTFTVTLRK